MNCPKCGAEVSETMKFCEKCGSPIAGEGFKKAPQAKKKAPAWVIVVAIAAAGIVLVAIIGILAALIIPNAMVATQKSKSKETMRDISTISTAIADYVTDNGIAPAQDGTYNVMSDLYTALCPFYIRVLPIKDAWGNNFIVYCGEACKGEYGITEVGSDDFIVVSLGKGGGFEFWEFDSWNPEAGFFSSSSISDFEKDLVMWNGAWIRAPRAITK